MEERKEPTHVTQLQLVQHTEKIKQELQGEIKIVSQNVMNLGIHAFTNSVDDFFDLVIISDNTFKDTVNSHIKIEQAYTLQIVDNVNSTPGSSTSTVDGAIVLGGCRYFTVSDNNIYNSKGDGIRITSSKYGTISIFGKIHDNIVKGVQSTAFRCDDTDYTHQDITFYENITDGNTTDYSLSGTRIKNLGFPLETLKGTLTEAGATINSGAILSRYLSLPKTYLGDFIQVSFSGSVLGLLVYGFVTSNNNIQINILNQTGAAVTIPAGAWNVLVSKK